MLADISYMEKNEKAAQGKPVTDLDVLQVLQKTVTKRKDSIAQFVCRTPEWRFSFITCAAHVNRAPMGDLASWGEGLCTGCICERLQQRKSPTRQRACLNTRGWGSFRDADQGKEWALTVLHIRWRKWMLTRPAHTDAPYDPPRRSKEGRQTWWRRRRQSSRSLCIRP